MSARLVARGNQSKRIVGVLEGVDGAQRVFYTGKRTDERTDCAMKKPVVGILAHVDAGKTTLSEALLYCGGTIRNMGRVDHKDAYLDTFELERQRGITIFSKQARIVTDDLEMTLLDTPGHVDFSMEMERTLQVLDYAILVISKTDGVQAHTETLWRLLKQYGIPTFVFVNKTDLLGDQFGSRERKGFLSELEKRLGGEFLDFSEPSGLMEEAAMVGESAMEEFLEHGFLRKETLSLLIAERKIFPCYFGSALKFVGIEELLKGISDYCLNRCYPEEFGAKVYKIARDDQGNRLTYLKVTGGSLQVKDMLQGEKVDQIRLYSGSRYELAKEAKAGCVCAATGPQKTYPGQGIGMEEETKEPVLSPVMTYQVLLPEEVQPLTMLPKLRQLEEEDPGLHVVWNEALQEIHVRIMGKVQLEILKSVIKERFGTEVDFGAGNIVYKETIAKAVEGIGHFEPLRHYAEVHLLLEPLPQGSGLVFHTDVSEDELDLNWQRLILTHLSEREHPGVLTGSPITDMRITLVAGKAHLKHTEGGDFRQATYRALRQGLKSTECVLLEPYHSFELTVPTEQIGRAMGDIQRMSGVFDPPLTEGEMSVLTGKVPVETSVDYMSEVNAYTKGRGRFLLQAAGYGPCHNTEEVLERIGYDSETDTENPTGSVFCAHGSGFYVKWDEVPQYKHVDSHILEQTDGTETMDDKIRKKLRQEKKEQKYRESIDLDRELEEIMLREFGSQKKKETGTGRARYISGKKSVDAGEYYRKYQNKNVAPVEDYLLVDGYNIIFAWDELKELAKVNLDAARGKLMDILCDYQGFTKCHLILVFDAYKVKGGAGEIGKYHNIHVVYTKEAETADMYIEKVTHEIGTKHRVRVATSDGLEQLIIMGHGAMRISAAEFEREVAAVKEKVREFIEGQ